VNAGDRVKTVFILGAGASKPAGVPLMADFLSTATTLWRTGQVEGVGESFSAVFRAISALQNVHSKADLDIHNLEAVFTAFEMAEALGKFPGLDASEIGGLARAMRTVITATIEQTLLLPMGAGPGEPGPPPPYNEFATLIKSLRSDASPKHDVAVITFNYDMALDYTFFANRTPIDYGLGEAAAQNALPVLKLHGSLNWGKCENNCGIVPWTLPQHLSNRTWPASPRPQTFRLAIGSRLSEFRCPACSGSVDGPYLVPPTWSKFGSYARLCLANGHNRV